VLIIGTCGVAGYAVIGADRVAGLVLDQAPVPGEQDPGCHDPVQPQVPGQQPYQGGDHGPVGPVGLQAGDLAAQDRGLMPEY
jgi:pimeloyl-ACP methyl ester carboxylesterase